MINGFIVNGVDLAEGGLFILIVYALIIMAIWEYRSPGGVPRRGILTLDTTLGDRLFNSILGSAFIFLA